PESRGAATIHDLRVDLAGDNSVYFLPTCHQSIVAPRYWVPGPGTALQSDLDRARRTRPGPETAIEHAHRRVPEHPEGPPRARGAEVHATAVIEDELMPATDPVCLALRSEARSEEHTSELQSRENLVCRLLLEKKKKTRKMHTSS